VDSELLQDEPANPRPDAGRGTPSTAGSASLAWRVANLRRYDLNLLLSLHALLHTRNVTTAGEWLAVTQPAMSTDLRRLRQLFADDLLVRVGREYQLTALASALVEPLTQVVVDIERALKWRPSFDAASETREFSVALSDHVLTLLLRPLSIRLQDEAPQVTIHTRALSSLDTDAVGATLRGEVDLSIGNFWRAEGALSEVLYTDRWVCAASADNPEVEDRMTLELFTRLPHLEWRLRTPVVQSHAEVLYQSLGIERRTSLTTQSFALLPYLLRNTRMIALVHERVARQFDGLKLLEPPVPIPDVVETMYWSAALERDPAHAWLRDLVRSVARNL
jgi:LysR family transcriptional regulator, nod-box dependent transcriptional activator